jgi:hypothetical protein
VDGASYKLCPDHGGRNLGTSRGVGHVIVQGLFAVIAAVVAVGSTGSAVTSPDGRGAASVGDRPLVAMTNPPRLVDLGNNGPVDGLAWLGEGRLAVATGLDSILHVLEPSGRRSDRWELDGEALAVVAAGRRAAVLMSPVDHYGRAWLAIDDPGRPPRRVPLPGIRAGRSLPEDRYEPPRTPALIVAGGDPVVLGARTAVRVDAATGRATVHRVPALNDVRQRIAFPVDGGRRFATIGPGLLYLDPRTWRTQRVAPGAGFAERWRDGALAGVGAYAVGFDGAGRRVFRRRLHNAEFVSVAPDGVQLLVQRWSSNGADVVRTLNP